MKPRERRPSEEERPTDGKRCRGGEAKDSAAESPLRGTRGWDEPTAWEEEPEFNVKSDVEAEFDVGVDVELELVGEPAPRLERDERCLEGEEPIFLWWSVVGQCG